MGLELMTYKSMVNALNHCTILLDNSNVNEKKYEIIFDFIVCLHKMSQYRGVSHTMLKRVNNILQKILGLIVLAHIKEVRNLI